MLTKESEILYCFARAPWKKYTFTELKKVSRKKSKSYIARVLRKLVADETLIQERIGHLPLYSLGTASKARTVAGFILENFGWKKRLPYHDLENVLKKIPTQDYVFLITGSYASGKHTAKSDIDVVILIDDSAEPKKVYAELSHYCEINIPPIHLYVFRNKEFIEMLTNREANYGKEIVKNNLILVGGQIYVKLVQEAIENGLRG